MSKEPWVVFTIDGVEVASYTVRGTFAGELADTRALLAYEHGVSVDEVVCRCVMR
ncbi:MAG: hypothetical protein J6Y20_07355 [Lachnospiraceae bacterium]|nr:hypothetical protein [Lachnospiraceae bacterium]